MPKSTELSELTRADLDTIARSLNDRPRKRLGFMKPSSDSPNLLHRPLESAGIRMFRNRQIPTHGQCQLFGRITTEKVRCANKRG